jgi:hypothetical protein
MFMILCTSNDVFRRQQKKEGDRLLRSLLSPLLDFNEVQRINRH